MKDKKCALNWEESSFLCVRRRPLVSGANVQASCVLGKVVEKEVKAASPYRAT